MELYYDNNGNWEEVKAKNEYGIQLNIINTTDFEPLLPKLLRSKWISPRLRQWNTRMGLLNKQKNEYENYFFYNIFTLCLALSFGQEVKYNTPQAGNPIIPILCLSYYPKGWRYLLSLRYYGWKWWRTRSFTSVDFKGFCELEHTTDELAEYTLYMGTGCNEGKGWQILYVLLPTLPNLLLVYLILP